jgi:hypothetical protein
LDKSFSLQTPLRGRFFVSSFPVSAGTTDAAE